MRALRLFGERDARLVEVEPPPPDHKLLHHPAVVASQHTAGVTQESRANITRIAALAFSDLAAGRMPPRIVNPAVKPRFAARVKAASEAGSTTISASIAFQPPGCSDGPAG